MEKNRYTLAMLLDDIQRVPKLSDEASEAFEITSREYQSKLIVMQLLIRMTDEYGGEEYENESKLRNAIEVKVKGDELLSGYLFFVSQNPQFDYSWNYMRKCRASYTDFLADAVRYIRNVVTDINMLAEKSYSEKEIHMVFDDVVDVVWVKETPNVKTTIRWENFHRIASVKKDYRISIVSKENVVLTSIRKEAADTAILIDAALKMLTTKPVTTE